MAPQALQIIITSCFVQKHVNDKIAVIEQNPLSVVVSLNAYGKFTCVLDLQVDFVGNCLILTDVRARTDDEVVGETRDFTQVQNNNVLGLFGLRGPYSSKPRGFRDFRDLPRLGFNGKIVVLLADSALLTLSYYNNRSASNCIPDWCLCFCCVSPGAVCGARPRRDAGCGSR